jgi:thiol-disulfide isomerase/thioredoxin
VNTIVPSYLPTSHPSRKARVALAVLVLASLVAPLAHATSIDGIGASSETFRTAITRHSLRTLDGRTFTLASLRGQVVVVNFWASWCPPCRRELPGLSSLHREIAKDGGLVIAISIDQDVRNVERFAKARGLALPIAQDGPDGLARELNLGHIPFTLVLDRQGVIAATATGGDAASLEKISTTARRLLTQTPPVSQAVSGGTP